jgi:hypothetical protein
VDFEEEDDATDKECLEESQDTEEITTQWKIE